MRLSTFLFAVLRTSHPPLSTDTRLFGDFEEQLCNSLPQLCGVDDLYKGEILSSEGNAKASRTLERINVSSSLDLSTLDAGTLLVLKDPPPLTELKSALRYEKSTIVSYGSNSKGEINAGILGTDVNLLPSFFTVRGTVTSGFGRGSATLGFPTANLPLSDVDTSDLPPFGVYTGWAVVEPTPKMLSSKNISTPYGRPLPVICNIGLSPTFATPNPYPICEAFIKGWTSGDFYGCQLRVMLVGGVRPEMKFDGIEELKSQIGKDVDLSMDWLDTQPAAAFKSDPFVRAGGVGRKGMQGLNGGQDEFDVDEWTVKGVDGVERGDMEPRIRALPLGKWFFE